MVIPAILFAFGLVLVIKGGGLFVDAAVWAARASGLPSVLIGATVVSIGTTLPELTVSLTAALKGKDVLAVGNAVGSVTANLGLIMALCLLLAPFTMARRQLLPKGGIMVLAVLSLAAFSQGGSLSSIGVAVLVALFALFLLESIKGTGGAHPPATVAEGKRGEHILRFILGLLCVLAGANLLVENGSRLALGLGVPESVIAVTLVAVGTSLPELVTAIHCIRKKQGALSVGNILGANIIDTTLILPLCTALTGGRLSFPAQSHLLDLPVCLTLCLLAILPAALRGRFSRWQGAAMLAVYGLYLSFVVSIG